MNTYDREAFVEMARLARRDHYKCEDCFYSCPQAKDEDGSWNGCNDAGSPCNCGADAHNAKVDALLAATLGPEL